MRWLKVMIALFAVFASAGHAWAQTDDALAALAYETVEPSRIKVGDSAILQVTSFGRLREVALPTVPGLLFEEMGRQQGLEFVNGTAVPATFIRIRVTAQIAGVFSIPGLTPTSHSIGLEVIKGDEPNPYVFRSQRPVPPPTPTVSLPKGAQLQAGGAAFVHLSVPTRDVYVGESVPVDIELGLRPGLVVSVKGLPSLKGSDFTLNNLSKEPERREQAIDGNTFVVLTWHSVLAAVKPGTFSLSVETPVTAKISTLSAADRAVASRLAFPLLQNMYNGVAPRDMTIASAPSELKVMPLPTQGQPADFSGAVGNFQISSDISPASAAAGDPLTLRLHVSGAGNFDRVDTPMLDHLDHWKTYPAKSSFKPTDMVGYRGEKVFEQPLIAAQPGEQSIPALELSFFNPTTRRYERAQTSPIKVAIGTSLAGGSLTALSGNAGPSGAAGATPGLRADHPTPRNAVSDLRPLYFQGPFLVIPTGLALMLAASWFAIRPRPARLGSKGAQRLLAQLSAAARDGDSHSFLDAARDGLLQTYAARWQLPTDQITPQELKTRLGAEGAEVERLFALAEETRYGGMPPGGADFQSWLRVIRGQLAGTDQ